MSATYRLVVRDRNFNRVAEISTFRKLELALRFNAPGTWRLELAKAAPIDAQGNVQSTSGYRQTVLNDGQAGYWRWDETSGTTAADASGNGRTGTYTAGFTLNQPGLIAAEITDGSVNPAVLLNGSTGYVAMPDYASFQPLLGSMSWGVWVQTTGASNQDIYRKSGGSNANGIEWEYRGAGGGVVWATFHTYSTGPRLVGTRPINDGQRHFVVVVLDRAAGMAYLYIDGTLDASVSVAAIAAVSLNSADAAHGWGQNINGTLDEGFIYPGALTPARVAAYYRAGVNQQASDNQVVVGTADTDAASLLSAKGAGIIVERNGVVLLSGPVRKLERRWSKDEDDLVAWGPDDTFVLTTRIALPVPSGPPYSSSAYDVRTGVASTIIRQYVDVNAGPGAVVQRQVAGLALAADPGIGTTVTGRARFHWLIELAQSLAQTGGGLGFRVVQVGTTRQFQVYQPADKTATAIFSRDLDNLAGHEYSLAAAGANYVYAGGGGVGTARTIVEGQDSQSVVDWDRVETFLDRRDTTDPTELQQAITDELAARAQQADIRLSPVDTEGLAFGTDYGLGDKVTAVIDTVPLRDLIRQVNITLTAADGEVVEPAVGTAALAQVVPTFFASPVVAPRDARADRRLSNLERV